MILSKIFINQWVRVTPSQITKMGKNNADSVVDKNLKIHNTQNVFICGSSVFPVKNGITTNLTIMTLANRLAKYLQKFNKKFVD